MGSFKFRKRFEHITLMCAALSLTPVAGQAMSAQEKGFAIAATSDRSDRGFGDSEVGMTMVLRSAGGQESRRELWQRTLEVPDEDVGDRTLIVFQEPADINGTALLSHAKILEPDNQWLYLPAFKRIKRISSVNKDGAFVGSEFSYEDFTALELNKFDYRHLSETACGEQTCDRVERVPRYEHSGYSRQVAWIDQDIYQVRKVEFYDRRNDLIKTLELSAYRQYDGKYWRAHGLTMRNEKTGKSTDLLFSDYRFKTGLTGKDFVKGVLKRIH